jgi:mannose-6-phosphate isomerase-like protein (cupin superfamily)
MAEFREPSGTEFAGHYTYKQSLSPYELYVRGEGIPIVRGIGVYDSREVELGDWPRVGGRGAFLYLDGMQAQKGMFLVEVGARSSLEPQRHLYDEFYLVIEGRGTTEVWKEGSSRKHSFEWQAGSLFTVPMNANFRFVNAGSSPALLLAANNAPPIFNIFQDPEFLLNPPFDHMIRFDESDDYFRPRSDIEADEVRGRAAVRANVFPDIINCDLPLDNQRAPGFRRIQPYFFGFQRDAGTGGFVAQYPAGRYSKGHFHASGAVIVCLRGAGYTFNWPVECGHQPWVNGKGDEVKIQEYKQGGLVAAAPGGGNWFHQHFSMGGEPLRIINDWGGPDGGWGISDDGEDVKAGNIYGINEGGRTILYPQEDPYVRKHFAERLAQVGIEVDMPESLYQERKS